MYFVRDSRFKGGSLSNYAIELEFLIYSLLHVSINESQKVFNNCEINVIDRTQLFQRVDEK